MKCCANCHFAVDGDGDTIHCNWTGNKRMPRDGLCDSYDGEHPDAEYWRKDSEAKDAEIVKLKAEVARLKRECTPPEDALTRLRATLPWEAR